MDQQNQILKLYAEVNVLITVFELLAVRNPCTFLLQSKIVLVQAWRDPEDSRSLRPPDFEIIGT
jgi:hypothetical protein